MMQIRYNQTERKGAVIKYIVIHDTGNRSKGADADAHFNYFNSGDRQSSADCFVDDTQALWVNDYNKYYTWHCGDGKGKNGITNKNSIGIELCINSDGDADKAKDRLIDVVASTAKKLSVPVENIVRHYDASGKMCPGSMSANNWEDWKIFMVEVKRRMGSKKLTDVKGHYAEEYIKKILDCGIVNGDGTGRFNPEEPLKRGDAAIMAANILRFLGK